MKKLDTEYLGLALKNPVIVSSSGLTNSVSKIEKAHNNGAAAVVLKSLFEEQINYEVSDLLKHNDYPEAEDYIKTYSRNNSLDNYLQLISDAKNKVDIPVIASINCVDSDEWIEFAQKIENAGADALELNVHIVALDKFTASEKYEAIYFEIIKDVKALLSIPVSVKISAHFTNLVGFVDRLSANGASGVVLFNRFYQPDIDVDKMEIVSADVFSSPSDLRHSLRWVGILSDRTSAIDISASTGVHSGEAVIKQLLAGATTVQVCSILYKRGIEYLKEILNDMEKWMDKKGYDSVDEFRGILSYKRIKQPAVYERVQFMRYFSNIE